MRPLAAFPLALLSLALALPATAARRHAHESSRITRDLKATEERIKAEIVGTVTAYEKRTGRKIEYQLDPKSEIPYTNLLQGPENGSFGCTEFCRRINKLQGENNIAKTWDSRVRQWLASGVIQADEIAVDPNSTSETPYTNADLKYSTLVQSRISENDRREEVQAAIDAYEKRSGKSSGFLLDPSELYPYSAAYWKQRGLVQAIMEENWAAGAWEGNARGWQQDGALVESEIVINPEDPYPYTAATQRLNKLKRERVNEARSKRDYEQELAMLVKLVGHDLPKLAHPEQTYRDEAYPYSYAVNHGDVERIQLERRYIGSWRDVVDRWTEHGLLDPSEITLPADSETPHLDAYRRLDAIFMQRRGEFECKQEIGRLAVYYEAMNRDPAELRTDSPQHPTYCDVRRLHLEELSDLDTELLNLRRLRLLRRAQLQAGDPNPIELPPKNPVRDRPLLHYFTDNVELFKKYHSRMADLLIGEMEAWIRQKAIYTVQKPFQTYHWGKRDRLSTHWQKPFSADDPAGAELVRSTAEVYFDPTATISGNRDGFYSVVDPVSTKTYGGPDNRWYLIRLQFPKGTRILNTQAKVDDDSQALLTQFGEVTGCSGSLLLFVSHPSEECARASARLIRDLRIGSVLYSYPYGTFGTECIARYVDPDYMTKKNVVGGAFILTDGSWVRPEDVRVFAIDTTDAVEERKQLNRASLKENSEPLWRNLEPANAPDNPEWRRENLLHCGTDFVRVVPESEEKVCKRVDGQPLPQSALELFHGLH